MRAATIGMTLSLRLAYKAGPEYATSKPTVRPMQRKGQTAGDRSASPQSDSNVSVLPGVQERQDAGAGIADMRPIRLGLGGPVTRMRKDRARLRLAPWAFTTRRVPQGVATSILPAEGAPRVGDLVMVRVDALGMHANLQLVNGRRRHMFVGDEIVVAYGHRYASNQFEAVVPETMGPCHLVAGGGIASRALSWHARVSKGPTHVTPVGIVADEQGKRVNLSDYRMTPRSLDASSQPATIAVVGTSMDSGKTQTAVWLARGLIAAGLRVGYAKVTGTGAGGDICWLRDAGADPVLDFTDLGMPSTYLADHDAVENALVELVAQIAHHGVDAIVLEIADGVYQRETSRLLASGTFARHAGGIVMAAQDSMGAAAGVQWLRDYPTPVLALSGVVTASPLQTQEAHTATGLPLYDREQLGTPAVAVDLLGQAQHHHDRAAPGGAGVA